MFSIFYFYILLKSSSFKNLKNDPVFITSCGIFLGSGLGIPSTLMFTYLQLLKISKEAVYLIGAIGGLGALIMNIFFLIAMLCIIKNK
jgi:hypothetical protein